MDTSSPAVFVNGELLHMYIGRKVRAVIQVIQSDDEVMTGKSTDERQLIVKGSPPLIPLMSYVEVIGTAESNQSIHADKWTNFGNTFDTYTYNQLCQLANGEFKAFGYGGRNIPKLASDLFNCCLCMVASFCIFTLLTNLFGMLSTSVETAYKLRRSD